MRIVGAFEAKTHLAALLGEADAGKEITITRHRLPVARHLPPDDQSRPDVTGTIERLRAFSVGQSLGDLSWHELRH